MHFARYQLGLNLMSPALISCPELYSVRGLGAPTPILRAAKAEGSMHFTPAVLRQQFFVGE